MKSHLAYSLAAVLAFAPAVAGAEPGTGSYAMERAETRVEHTDAASSFRAKAAELRQEAQRHRSVANAYVGGKSANGGAFQRHHRKLADAAEAMAADYEEMARMHDAEAASAS